MKRFFKVGLIFAVMLTLALFAAACGDKTGADSVHIEKFNMPRLSYVQGQELDLSGGKLTVIYKDATTEVALDSDEVKVVGYDKNKVGEQTLTVSYKNKSTELKITVIPRIAAEDYASDYFIGETFAFDIGHINFADDNASVTPVAFNADGVKLEGFDSSSAGTANVSVSYGGYTGTFAVKIHTVDSMSLTAPQKTDYDSHEEEFDLKGGYITVKAPADVYKKDVLLADLPKSDISGFDPSAATEKNSPLRQNISVNYGGRDFEFTLNVRYSDVSYIRDTAAACKNSDFTGDDMPSIEVDLGKHALESVNKYAAFDVADRIKIKAEEMEAIARVAAVYGKSAWVAEAEKYSDIMTFSDNGALMFLCKTKTATKEAYSKLADENEPIVAIGKTLMFVKNSYTELKIGENTTVGKVLASVFDPAGFSTVRAYMEFMFALDEEIIKCKNAQWSNDSLSTLLGFIKQNGDYLDSGKRSLYTIVADTWNGSADMFDKIYAYCYEEKDIDSVNTICDLYVPGKVGELYNTIVNTLYESMALEETEEFETTWFAYYFSKAYELYTQIKEDTAGQDSIQAWLFKEVKLFEMSLEEALEYCNSTATYSYVKIFANVLTDELVSGLWGKYLGVIDTYLNYTDTEIKFWSDEAFGSKIDELINDYLKLSPASQLKFMMSLYPFYTYSAPDYGFDILSEFTSQFTALIALRAQDKLTEKAFDLYIISLFINEDYARRYLIGIEDEAFIKNFEGLQRSVAELTGEDADSFKTVSAAYDNCKTYYDYLNGEPSNLGEWQEVFDMLADAVARVRFAYNAVNKGYKYYAPLFSAYETVVKLSKQILETAPENIKQEYYLGDFDVPVYGEKEGNNVVWSLDYAMYMANNIFAVMQVRLRYGSDLMYYAYAEAGVSEFLAEIDHVIWQKVYNIAAVSFVNIPKVSFDEDKIISTMRAMREIELEKRNFYFSVDSGNLYYEALDLYFITQFSQTAASATKSLMQAEKSYFNYLTELQKGEEADATVREKFLEDINAAIAAYNALEPADKTKYDSVLSETYAYYTQKKTEVENVQPSLPDSGEETELTK